MREKREQPLTAKQTDKFARFRQVAKKEPTAISDALIQITAAFSSMVESSEALTENLDLTPMPREASIKEKVAARKKFAVRLNKFADEAPEKVEEAVNEIYNAVDEVALALENLASNLGFELSEVQEEPVGIEETTEVEAPVIEECSMPPI